MHHHRKVDEMATKNNLKDLRIEVAFMMREIGLVQISQPVSRTP